MEVHPEHREKNRAGSPGSYEVDPAPLYPMDDRNGPEPAVYREAPAERSKPKPGLNQQPDDDGSVGCCGFILIAMSMLLIIITLPFSLFMCIKTVQEYERAVIFRLGRCKAGGAAGPGLFFIIPCVDKFVLVDLRTFSYDIPPQEFHSIMSSDISLETSFQDVSNNISHAMIRQEWNEILKNNKISILTRDSVTVAVDAVIYARVFDPTISVTNVEHAQQATRLLAATTLRNVLGTRTLSDVLGDREGISNTMQATLDEATDPWGIKVERVEVKDVRLPMQMQRAMAAEAEATREAKAKVIAADGEMQASRSLKEAADVISQSGAALQLRYLQTLNSIAAEKNSTIIFPLPVDMLGAAMKK